MDMSAPDLSLASQLNFMQWIVATYTIKGALDGNLDPQIAIYRDAEDGPCGICMLQKEVWKDKVIDKILIKNAKLLFKVGF